MSAPASPPRMTTPRMDPHPMRRDPAPTPAPRAAPPAPLSADPRSFDGLGDVAALSRALDASTLPDGRPRPGYGARVRMIEALLTKAKSSP